MKKAIVYIDGFNLYYGCLKKTEYKWLNVEKLIGHLCKDVDVVAIKYYTAQIKTRPLVDDEQKPLRQQIYWRALKTIPNLEIIKGYYLTHRVQMKKVREEGYVLVYKTEEKGTDVNIASHIIHDGHNKEFEMAIVVTNDSDLVEPVKIVTQELKLEVIVVNPFGKNSIELQRYATSTRHIRKGVLEISQFEDIIHDEVGEITKPIKW